MKGESVIGRAVNSLEASGKSSSATISERRAAARILGSDD